MIDDTDTGSRLSARPPWLGPMISPDLSEDIQGHSLLLSAGADPTLGAPVAVCWVPVQWKASNTPPRWEIDDERVKEIDAKTPPSSEKWNFLERIEQPDTFEPRIEEANCDWLTWRLSYWMLERKDPHVAVLLIYDEVAGLYGGPVADPFPTNTGKTIPGPGWNLRLQPLNKNLAAPSAEREASEIGFEPCALVNPAVYPVIKILPADYQKEVLQAAWKALAAMPTDTKAVPLGIVSLPQWSDSSGLCLAMGSCQYPRGMLDYIPSTQSWQRLNALFYQTELSRPQLLVLPGDQIYADATAGLFDPTQRDDRYRNPYLSWLSEGRVQSAMRRMITLSLPDDHEIDDNWEPVAPEPDTAAAELNTERWHDGITGFLRYQRPAPRGDRIRSKRLRARELEDLQAIGFDFQPGGIPVFMLDTRTRRTRRSSELLGDARLIRSQKSDLQKWLLDQDSKLPKLIVSPAAILPRHRHAARAQVDDGVVEDDLAALRSDGWDGYPGELFELLAFIVDKDLQKVVFLSGDEHLGLIMSARLKNGSGVEAQIYSIHSPSLYAPFTFANARSSDFILNETFAFSRGTPANNYTCDVATRTVHGCGFVVVEVKQVKGVWSLDVRFDVDQAREDETSTFNIALSQGSSDYCKFSLRGEPPEPVEGRTMNGERRDFRDLC